MRLLPGAAPDRDALEPSIYRFVLRYSLGEQILLVVLTLLSFPVLYYSLELPKVIINQAIGGKHFPRQILGAEIAQIPYLLVLCAGFLVLVIVNGWFKYYINVRKGQLGERLLRRLRFELCDRILRFPLPAFGHLSAGGVIAMVTAELEPLGEFIGDAFALPIFQAGTLATTLAFMFVQDPALGGAAVLLYPVQGYVIPKLQRKVRQLGRERVRMMRSLADRIGETIAGRVDIRANDAAAAQLAELSAWLGRIYTIRFDIYNRKFFAKFLNNFINQLTPFFFLAIGGYFVIEGRLSLGALVAVLAAYKDLSAPWKELLDFYQQQQDVAIKYQQVIEQFQAAEMLDRRLLLEQPERIPHFEGDIVATGLVLVDEDGTRLLDGLDFAFGVDQHVAIVGPSDSGKNVLVQLLARLLAPTAGRITIGGADLNALPLAVSGRRIGYVGAASHLFAASLRENLLLGLRHPPLRRAGKDGELEMTDLAGARGLVAYEQAGVTDAEALDARMAEVLRLFDLEDEVYALGLRGRIEPEQREAIAPRIIAARHKLYERLEAAGMAKLVERFDPERYNRNATLAQNLLFGAPIGPRLADDELARNPFILRLLARLGLLRDLLEVGRKAAETMVEIFADLRQDHALIEEFSLIRPQDLPLYSAILGRLKRSDVEALPRGDREALLSLAFLLAPARHRLDLIDSPMQERIVAARHVLMRELPESLRDAVEFFAPDGYNGAATVQENLLFGKIAGGAANARERVHAVAAEVIGALGLRDAIVKVGLGADLGSGGMRLSPAQRQKVAIARAVLKRPDFLVLNEATAILDEAAQASLMATLRREFAGRGLVWSLHRVDLARGFDRVLVMERGRLAAMGRYEEVRPRELAARQSAAE